MWEAMGYKQLPTGEWYEVEEESLGPSLEFMHRYPHGHVCRACRDHFRSTKYHDAFCESCRSTMKKTREAIEKVLDAASKGNEKANADALRKVQGILECPRCHWNANQGRFEPVDVKLIREYLGSWIEAAHIHWMRHNFSNRFPYSSKFVSKERWKEHVEMSKLFEALDRYRRKNPNIIEITYSDDGIPLYAEQKRSKYALQFPPAR